MKNFTLVFFRELCRQSEQTMANILKIGKADYISIEEGNRLVTFREAKRLARHFGTVARYFYEAPAFVRKLKREEVLFELPLWRQRYAKCKEFSLNKAEEKMKQANRCQCFVEELKSLWEAEEGRMQNELEISK